MDTYIEINDSHEIYIWARMLRITPHELVRLAGEVGPSVERIRDELKRRELANTRGRGLIESRKHHEHG